MNYNKEYIYFLPSEFEPSKLSEEDTDHLYDHLKGLVYHLYQTIDIDEIKYHLEEILYIFGGSLPKEELKIQKKPTPEEEYKDKFYKSYVGYTRAYAEMMSMSKKRK